MSWASTKKNNPGRTARQVEAFREALLEHLVSASGDEGVRAVLRFLAELSNHDFTRDPHWPEIIDSNPVLTFRLVSDSQIVFNRPEVMSAYRDSLKSHGIAERYCLVTGRKEDIATLHPSIKGVWGAQSSGASLVSFNKDSFSSWGKNQGDNSPIGASATFEYSTALNYLLRTDCPSRFQMGETSVVCWAEKESDLETLLPAIFSDAVADDPDANSTAIRNLMATVHNGAFLSAEGGNRFHVLGLSPNAARIAVRFWQVGTVAEFSVKLGEWFKDIEIAGRRDNQYPPLKAMLRSTALLGKDEYIPPTLIGETIRAILSGTSLPASLFHAVIKRVKAEKGAVTAYRAALLKACLNRKYRQQHQHDKEIAMALDKNETRIGYRLGRLFAVLEKLQEDAHPGLNATIRDRYYSSASCTPRAVFGTLMRLHSHHLKKLSEPAWRIAAQRNMAEIMADIGDFPSHLDLENQGLFAIGYYHQRQDLFTSRTTSKGEQA